MEDSSLFIDILLWTVYLLLAITVAAAIWSAVHGVRTHSRSTDPMTTRYTSMIGYATSAFVALTLFLTYLLASTQPLVTNGTTFADTHWLRLTDMFIFTSILLIAVCFAVIVVAKFRR